MADIAIDTAAARHFLALLGKNGDARLRAIPHKHTPPKIKARLGARKFGRDLRAITKAQEDGLGIYVVINRGGDNKESITECVSYFAEFDGQDETVQLHRVQHSGLPEPSLIVRTGGGSLHFYWLLLEPMQDTAQWQADMKRLAAHLESDTSINDPSRVMRLPGCWYMDSQQQPVAKVELIHEFDARYSREQIISCLPEPAQPTRTPQKSNIKPKAVLTVERALDQLNRIPPRTPGNNTRDAYLRLLWGLAFILGPEQAGTEMAKHSPAWAAEEDLIAKAAEADGRITDGTFFEVARKKFKITSSCSCNRVEETAGAAHGKQPIDAFLLEADSLKRRLDDGLEKIDTVPDVATRSVALHTLQQELGLNDKRFASFVQVLSEAKAPKAAESFEALMAEEEGDLSPCIEDLFPSGLVLIAAEGFGGKTNTAYQIAEAVTNGRKFAGQFQARQAPALIVQMDESKTDARRKFKVLDLRPAEGALTIKWHFSPMMFPELRTWIRETGAKLVVLDSLLTIAGGEISPKDAEFGLLIYRLNQLAAELGLTILLLHHVVKGGGKPRTEITKDDIFGTAYVYNGASEAWGLWQTREDGNPDPIFNLRCLKSRSGFVDVGTTYQFVGNDEDKRLLYRGMAGRTVTLDQIRNTRECVLALLRSADGAGLDPKAVNERLQLGNADYARRLCRQLYETPDVPIGRKSGPSPTGGGRAPYLYFWAGPRDINASAECRNSKSQSGQGISFGPVSADPREQTDQFQHDRQSFGTEEHLSERGECGGIGGGFRDISVSRVREASSAPLVPSPRTGSSWDMDDDNGDDPHWGPRPFQPE